MYALRERERVLDLIEGVTGGRFHPNFNRIGGVKPAAGAGPMQKKLAQDLPKGFLEATSDAMDRVLTTSDELEDLVAGNEAFAPEPDLLVLLARLCIDREVSPASRRLIVGALAYFLTPVDLLPEAFVGVGGFLDDVVLVSLVLSHSLNEELEPLAVKHWSGNQELRVVLADVSGAGAALLGFDLYGRLKRFLARRGVRIEDGD